MAKEIVVNTKVKVVLQDEKLAEDKYTVKFSITNELGHPVQNEENKDITEMIAEFDSTLNRYCAIFTLNAASTGKYYGLMFDIKDKDGIFVQSDFAKVTLTLRKPSTIMLVPAEVFKDQILNGRLDDKIKKKIENYPLDGIEEWLLAATGELETDLEMTLTPRTIENERHDWTRDNMWESYWQIQTFEWPIISVQSYSLYYGTFKFSDIPADYLTVSEKMGIIEYNPIQGQQFYMVMNSFQDINQFAIQSRGMGGDRIPNLFAITYTAGLNYYKLYDQEQAEIRSAINRRAMLKGLARISPEIIQGSQQISVDGLSYNSYSRGLEWLNEITKHEMDWISAYKRKHNKHFKGLVV